MSLLPAVRSAPGMHYAGLSVESSGELLSDTGYEFVRADCGDLVPPNAVIGRVKEPEGSLYLGRIGGKTPCSISSDKGRIKSFCHGNKKVQSVRDFGADHHDKMNERNIY